MSPLPTLAFDFERQRGGFIEATTEGGSAGASPDKHP